MKDIPSKMSQYCLHIALDPYLRQWFVHDCGGQEPVSLERASVESEILEVYLTKPPSDYKPEPKREGEVAIFIPTFRHRPAEVYNYLPRRARAALVDSIRNRFDVALWNDLHNFGAIGRRQDELIYAWLEKHGIEISDANWNAVAKRYQRQRDLYLSRLRAKASYEPKKSY